MEVLRFFVAAFSINIALRIHLLTPVICFACGYFLDYHNLSIFGALGAVVLSGSLINYYDWEPFSVAQTVFGVATSIVFELEIPKLFPQSKNICMIIPWIIDAFTLPDSILWVKFGWLAGVHVLFRVMYFTLFDSQVEDELLKMKIEGIFLMIFGGLACVALDYLKKKNKDN